MARFIQDVVLNKPDDSVYFMMNDYLRKNGFSTSDWKGESVYRAGDGFIEAYKYLKWSYANGTFHLEAWMKGSFGKDMDLDGFVACVAKKPYKESLMQLISLLQQTLPDTAYTQNNASAQTGESTNAGPIPVQTLDNYKAAQQGLIFGILALVFCWSPIICILMSIVAFTRCRMGNGSSKANLAKAGKVCSVVALCVTACLYIINIILEVMLAVM